MLFNPTTRVRRLVAPVLASAVVGGTAAGAVAAVKPKPAAVQVAAATSSVPAPLTRAETAAEDVIGYLEKGRPAKSKAEVRILRNLAHGAAADALRHAGVSQSRIAAFQRRADRTARLSLGGAPTLKVSQAANSVSQLMPGFYARFHDPVPAAVLKLDYLDRQVQLDAQAGDRAKLRQTIGQLETTWRQVRPQLVKKAGGTSVASAYDQHVAALRNRVTLSAAQKYAVHGLDVVDQMEKVFLGL